MCTVMPKATTAVASISSAASNPKAMVTVASATMTEMTTAGTLAWHLEQNCVKVYWR